MKRQGSSRMTAVWLGVVVGILVAGGERVKASFTRAETSWLVVKARDK